MSPIDIEKKITKFENDLITKLSASGYSVFFVTLVLLSSLYLILPVWTKNPFPEWSRFFIAQDRIWALTSLLSGAYLFHFTKDSFKPLVAALSIACSWIIPIYLLGSFRLEALAPLIYIALNTLLLYKYKRFKIPSLIISVFMFLVLILFLGYDVILNKDGKIFQYFSILHLEVIIFFYINMIFSTNNSYLFYLNPLLLFSPLPIPDESSIVVNKNEKKFYLLKGLLFIAEAQVLLLIIIFIFNFLDFKIPPSIPVQFYLFIIFISAGMKICSGLLWMYGIKSPATSHFLLLAKSPLETWQKGSVFFAKFIFSKIYLPLWIRMRSHILSTTFSISFILFHLYLFHEVILGNLLVWLFPSLNFMSSSIASLKQQALWVILWILWILFFEFTLSKIDLLKKSSLGHWLLVFITHLGNMSIIPLTLYLSGILS